MADDVGPRCRVSVLLTPSAHNDALLGWRGELLLARVKAPPVEGEANVALERLLARALGVALSDVGVVAGAASRRKTLLVQGLDAAGLRQRLQLAML